MKNYKSGIESKRRLYESAKRHFIQDGYQGAVIRDIVADADSKLGLFTYYFDGKAELAAEVVREFLSNVKLEIKKILVLLNLDDDALLHEMVHYRCVYRCISCRPNVDRFWNEAALLSTFEYANFDTRKRHLEELVDGMGRMRFSIEKAVNDEFLSILTSASIGIEKQLYHDMNAGILPLTIDDVADIFFEFFYTKIIANKGKVYRSITLSREIARQINYVVGDDFSVELTLKPDFILTED